MTVTYSQKIAWHDFSGTKSAVVAERCATPQEALFEALKLAKAFGWTPPRWWQWWRWEEAVRADILKVSLMARHGEK